MSEVSCLPTLLHIKPSLSSSPPLSLPHGKPRRKIRMTKAWKINAGVASSPSSTSGSHHQTLSGQVLAKVADKKNTGKKRVFFLDVNPLCYAGSTPSLHSFGHWVSLFFRQVSLRDPVIAVSLLSFSLSPQMYGLVEIMRLLLKL